MQKSLNGTEAVVVMVVVVVWDRSSHTEQDYASEADDSVATSSIRSCLIGGSSEEALCDEAFESASSVSSFLLLPRGAGSTRGVRQ